ncbi:COX15/CtaA family protein [Thalassoglobus polymorphus]|uniref:Heme A synthase n=1 Tax=Thalassoglobus polymorphus TaxID=2527994 RepID=A0A517QRU7_9PLAN|nr:COX15/CtaA family protein [Thalassoglobus polymorphus]QDT34353.1 Heme A synthase [Thalassoglobus polymorphus]
MSQIDQTNWFRRLAVTALGLTMITLIFGALTTSKNAGMAFRDWPTSDGHMMITYPWLSDFAKDWDKFLEHGHRLAGMVIGIWSIILVVFAFMTKQRRTLKVLSVCVLLGVIFQGLLGGFRVQLDERGLAMVHGAFAALVFSVMGALIVLSGKQWETPEAETERTTMTIMKVLSVLLLSILVIQYLFGGMIRHQGSGLHEHLALGFVSLGMIFVNFTFCSFSNVSWLRKSGLLLLLIGIGQVGLGLGTWVLKFGFTPTGYVPISDSIQQVTLRTAHTVWGIVTFQAAFVHLLKVYRVGTVSKFSDSKPITVRNSKQVFAVEGGQE